MRGYCTNTKYDVVQNSKVNKRHDPTFLLSLLLAPEASPSPLKVTSRGREAVFSMGGRILVEAAKVRVLWAVWEPESPTLNPNAEEEEDVRGWAMMVATPRLFTG